MNMKTTVRGAWCVVRGLRKRIFVVHALRTTHYALFVLIALSFLIAPIAHADEITTSADIRAVTNFVGGMGYCNVKTDTKSADCATQTTYCDANKLIAWVNDNIEFIGGGVPQLKQQGFFTQAMNAIASAPSGDAAAIAGASQLPQQVTIPDTIFTYLRKDPRNRSRIPPLGESACFCQCTNSDAEKACADKPAGTPFQVQQGRLFTREECIAACGNHPIAQKCAGALPPIESVDIGSASGQAAARAAASAADDQMTCFTPSDCAQQKGIFEADTRKICSGGMGRCVAQDIDVPLNTPIGTVTTIAGIGNYVSTIFRYALSVLVIITTVMFIWGAFLYMLGSAKVGNIEKGRSIMKDAIIGMILVLSSVLILRTLNPATVNLTKLKVYMINTKRFISASYCGDLIGQDLLGDAGTPPSLKSFDEVSKAGFSTSKTNAACGHSYYIQGSTGGLCTGTYCPESGEACVSCASGDPTECAGIKSSLMVCDKTNFGGTIAYSDGMKPMNVYLVFVCRNGADPTKPLQTIGNVKLLEAKLATTADISGTSQSDTDTAGKASFKIALTADELASATSFCQGSALSGLTSTGGGLMGALIGVQYNNPGIHITESDHLLAMLSTGNCTDASQFDGYAEEGDDESVEAAQALACGLKRSPPHFNANSDFWSSQTLDAAAEGRQAITCNFKLNATTALTDASKVCPK